MVHSSFFVYKTEETIERLHDSLPSSETVVIIGISARNSGNGTDRRVRKL
jgi:hypothetical protein